ncbi:MAG: beta strand repeat-containing protein, partial [Pigmentiphaga sp.]
MDLTRGLFVVGLTLPAVASASASDSVTVSATITLPGGETSADSFFNVWHNAADTSSQAIISVIKKGNGTVTLSGRPTSTWLGTGLVGAQAYGLMDKKHHTRTAGGAPGPDLDARVSAAATIDLGQGGTALPAPWAYAFHTVGADALSFLNDHEASSGAAGGQVHLTVDTGDTFTLTGHTGAYASNAYEASLSLPWVSAATILGVMSQGGKGALVQTNCGYSTCWNGYGTGGDGGDVSISVAGGQTFQLGTSKAPLTSSANAPAAAVMAVSLGGNSDVRNRNSSFAGSNGKGGIVTVDFGAAIRAEGAGANPVLGVVAASVGGATRTGDIDHVDPVVSGPGGNVKLTLTGADIQLDSANAIGVLATSTSNFIQSRASNAPGDPATFGDVAVSVDAASRVVVGSQPDRIASQTDTVIGVLANSAVTWAAQPFLGTPASMLVSPGHAGSVSIRQDGAITATGANAIGVLGQSIAGDGAGVSGGAHAFVGAKGGNGGTAANVVYTGNGGSVMAQGDGARGVLLQSIAGGGGNGGNAAGLFVAVGGDGGKGGTAGTVSFSQRNGASVVTTGDYAQGVVLQSVGGGGGNGGYAKAFSLGVPASAGIGGKGGIGGTGGDVHLGGVSDAGTDSSGSIVTQGQHAHGLLAQTLGGGGGTGGAASSYNANDGVAVSVAVGGAGGGAGDGGNITGAGGAARASSLGDMTTTGHDAHGVLLQSVGGGGGVGGGATAAALALAGLPQVPNITVAIGVGGSGGAGGKGGNIHLDLLNTVQTRGAGAHGVVLQSVGGGGGSGADSTAGAGSLVSTAPFAFNGSLAVGGTGGAGGQGGTVDLSLSDQQSTAGHQAVGILAQSIGGGGGVGGIGNATAVTALALKERNAQLTIGVGGQGGSGGTGGSVSVSASDRSAIQVTGAGSSAIVAQSIGGGGGVAGNAGTQALGGQYNGKVAVGGHGGTGHHGGSVAVNYTGRIQTGLKAQVHYLASNGSSAATSPMAVGGSSHGILAQSIGGGGGVGGNADPSAGLLPDLAESWIEFGNKMLDAKGFIRWFSRKVANYPPVEFEWPKSYTASLAVGGSGGAAGDGGKVDVAVGPGSVLLTHGHRSYGILAQSVGGGGGEAGHTASDALVDLDAELSPFTGGEFSIGVNVGGSGGGGGKGGDVTVQVNNPYQSSLGNALRTTGYGSHVIMAQSVGGGGGIAHEGSIFGVSGTLAGLDTPEGKLGAFDRGSPSVGNAGSVSIGTDKQPLSGHFYSAGDDAGVLLAQSVGGGGGLLSFGCTNSGRGQSGLSGSACHTNLVSVEGAIPTDDYVAEAFVNGIQSNALSVIPGATDSDGGAVTVVAGNGTVLASLGDRSPAIVAQSVGSGGGYATAASRNVASTQIGDNSGASGSAGDVSVYLAATRITTSGHGAWGVLAQSVAAGGGVLGDLAADRLTVPGAFSTVATQAPGVTSGNIDIQLTSGSQILAGQPVGGEAVVNAHAIVAQSLGSGGGILGGDQQRADAVLEWVVGSGVSGQAGQIRIGTEADTLVSTAALGGVAILAQSAATAISDARASNIQIDIGGRVVGGRSGTNPASGAKLSGVGVLLSGGAVEGLDQRNTIVVAAGGELTTQDGAASGQAILADYGVTDVENHGTVTGSIDLGSTPGTVVNAASGVMHAGNSLRLAGSSLHNHGTLHIAGEASVGSTRLEGDLLQHPGGRLVFTVDPAGQGTDHLQVTGRAQLQGRLDVRSPSLLPGRFHVLQAGELQLGAVAGA